MPGQTNASKKKFEPRTPAKERGYSQFAPYAKVGSPKDGAAGVSLTAQPGQVAARLKDRPKFLSRLCTLTAQVKADHASKVNDGLTPPILMILLTVVYDLTLLPIERAFKLPGLLVFVLLILALGAIALDRSIQARYSQAERAFQGMLAGMFFWFSASTANHLASTVIITQANALYLLLVTMVVIALWRSVLPVGGKFFALVFLLNWAGRFFFTGQLALFRSWNFPVQVQVTYGWIAIACLVMIVVWMFVRSKRQIQRSWAAVGIWFCGMQALSLFLGWPQ